MQKLLVVFEYINLYMEGEYYSFYESNCPWPRAEVTDIDELLNAYLMPIEEFQKNDYLNTRQSTFNLANGQKDGQISDIKQPLSQVLPAQKQIKLEISAQLLKQRQQKEKRLQQNQTLNLNAYFHQQISGYLKQLATTQILPRQQLKEAKKYWKATKSFNSHRELFNSPTIKLHCFKYLSSPDFVARVWRSNKMSFKRKKNVVKYLNKFCRSLSNGQEIKTWKN